jgi:hypothetical protein
MLPAAFAQPEAQPALRFGLFALLLLVAAFWSRRHYRAASALFIATHGFALFFWLGQIHEPVGLAADHMVQQRWARVAVAHAVHDSRASYLIDSVGAATPLTFLAATGVSPRVLQAAAIGSPFLVVLSLAFAAGSIRASLPNRCMAAALASSNALLWNPLGLADVVVTSPESGIVSAFILAGTAAVLTVFRVPARASMFVIVASLVASIALGEGDAVGVVVRIAIGFVAAFLLTPRVRVLAHTLRTERIRRPLIESLAFVFVGGASAWFWWEPSRTVSGFEEARAGESSLSVPLEWRRVQTPRETVIASSPAYAALVSAHTGRRTLIDVGVEPLTQPIRRERLLQSLREGRPDAELARRFEVGYWFVGPGDAAPSLFSGDPAFSRPVYSDGHDFRVFRLLPQ